MERDLWRTRKWSLIVNLFIMHLLATNWLQGVPKPACAHHGVSSGVKNNYFDSDGTVFDDLDKVVETADYENGPCSLSSSYDSVS
ncbi:hypothetical protein Tco_1302811 [Tanacetum coccineum]